MDRTGTKYHIRGITTELNLDFECLIKLEQRYDHLPLALCNSKIG